MAPLLQALRRGDEVAIRRTGEVGVVVMTVGGDVLIRIRGHVERVARKQLADAYVVETAPLAAAIETFVARWNATRPMRGSGSRGVDPSHVEPVNPYTWLANETGLHRDAIHEARKPDRFPVTDLHVAEALVAAGLLDPAAYHDGTLTVRRRESRRTAPRRRERGGL
jgi:hypothetical protein